MMGKSYHVKYYLCGKILAGVFLLLKAEIDISIERPTPKSNYANFGSNSIDLLILKTKSCFENTSKVMKYEREILLELRNKISK